MKKKLLSLFFLIATLISGNFVFAQEQIVNKSVLSNDIVKQKIAFLDSVRKTNIGKQQQDNIYFKLLHEQGYSRQYIDSLHKAADPNFIAPTWYPPADEIGLQQPIRVSQVKVAQHAASVARPYSIPSTNEVNSNSRQTENKSSSNNNNLNSYKWSNSPSILSTTGPEQDCINGISVCQLSYTQPNSYTGYGTTQELNYPTNGTLCLHANEQASVWYIFTVLNTGNLTFTINTTHDYDWAIYDLTAIGGCSYVPTATPVSCNFSGTYGNTGISTTNGGFANSTNAAGIPWNADLAVTATHTYAMIVDNYSMDAVGYTLTFDTPAPASGVTASIVDNTQPTLVTPAVNN